MGLRFPNTVEEFLSRFSSESRCAEYLFKLRWPNGFRCRECQGTRIWRTGWRRIECAACGKESSLTAGTALHKTRVPLRVWLWAAFLLTRSKQGLSASELARQADIRQETAWLLLHKLRHFLQEWRQLGEVVEADEALVGGKEKGFRGRASRSKALVAVAVEDRGSHAGRVRMEMIRSGANPVLLKFVSTAVAEADSTEVRTDGWAGYDLLERFGYRHTTLIARSPAEVSKLLPWVHRVISNFKSWLQGTFRGAIRQAYLPFYINEFVYRFNRRSDEPALFARLLNRIVNHSPVTLAQLRLASRG